MPPLKPKQPNQALGTDRKTQINFFNKNVRQIFGI